MTDELQQSERTAAASDADVFADIPHARIEELVLELQVSNVIDHLKVVVRNLDLSLLLRTDLGNVARMVREHGDDDGGSDAGLVRRLTPAIAASAGTRLVDRTRSERSAPAARGAGRGRARTLARAGGKGAALAAAGLAGAALARSGGSGRRKPRLRLR